MLTLGVDIGSLTTKSVILNERQILAWSLIQSSDNVEIGIEEAVNKSLTDARISLNQIESISFTGVGKNYAPYAGKQLAEGKCSIAGARFLNTQITGVVDIGAESSRVTKCDSAGRVVGYAVNDKCAAGTGIFLDTMSKLLKIDLTDSKALDKVENKIDITSTCVVFAESEVVSLIHKGVNRFDLWMGINRSVANRVCTLVNKLRLDGITAVIGGVARNPVFVFCLREMLGNKLFVPDDPELTNAMGASILAKEQKR